jgi:hypothetical protein
MKTRILLAIAMIATTTFVSAQSSAESKVKILPGATANIVKVLYAEESSSPVTVKFITNTRGEKTDKVRNFRNGFLKRYDVSKINDADYLIEVSSDKMTVTYRIVPAADKSHFVAQLAGTRYNDLLVRKE